MNTAQKIRQAKTVVYWMRQFQKKGDQALPRMKEEIFWHIIKIVSQESGVDFDAILKPGRQEYLVCARFVFILLLREYTHNTFSEIAFSVYGRDGRHDNAFHACRKASERINHEGYSDYTFLYKSAIERIVYPKRRYIAEVAP